MSSRRGFLKILAAAAAAPTVMSELPEAVAQKAAPVISEISEQVLPKLAYWQNRSSVSQLQFLFWHPEVKATFDSGITLDDVREYAAWKGVEFDDLCSRISTMADTLTHNPIHQDGLIEGLFGRNAHNMSDLDLLYGETWDRSMDELTRMGYNVGPRGRHSSGCPKSWFDEKDHLSAPRDVELYKEVRKRALSQTYGCDEDGNYHPDYHRLTNSEVFFEDEYVVLDDSTSDEYVYDEETGEGRWVAICKALVPIAEAPVCKLLVNETHGPDFSFVLLRPELKFV